MSSEQRRETLVRDAYSAAARDPGGEHPFAVGRELALGVGYAPDGYAKTTHRFAEPGDYLVRVERTGPTGARAMAHLHVRVESSARAAAGPRVVPLGRSSCHIAPRTSASSARARAAAA